MLKKLQIIAYSDPELRRKTGSYGVQINPEVYNHQHKTTFAHDRGIDSKSALANFKSRAPETLSFVFVLDATGVVPGRTQPIATELGAFNKVAYTYNGSIHSPNYLRVLWGALSFKCLLAKLDVKYELFSPAGVPLRAKVSVVFRQHQTPEDLARSNEKKSADLTHTRRIRDGDTLPVLCHDVYNDTDLYPALARANDLHDLVHLHPGGRLRFPRVEE